MGIVYSSASPVFLSYRFSLDRGRCKSSLFSFCEKFPPRCRKEASRKWTFANSQFEAAYSFFYSIATFFDEYYRGENRSWEDSVISSTFNFSMFGNRKCPRMVTRFRVNRYHRFLHCKFIFGQIYGSFLIFSHSQDLRERAWQVNRFSSVINF